MAYINIFVSQQAYAKVEKDQLILKNNQKEESFPLEDIQSILFDNLQTNISTYTLNAFAQNNITVYFCDKNHLPSAYLLPYNSYFAQLKMFKVQTGASAPLIKQLWKDIVINKILNQHRCLQLCRKKSDLNLQCKKVLSGDSSNVEAVAANKYFKQLFSSKFTRDQENDINAALNYGYAIIRGDVARNLVSHGLLPFLGLKHRSILNNFNLADDLMEVFRPFVDLFVYQNSDMPFDTRYKSQLVNLLNCNCNIGEENYTLSYAIQIYIQSFIDSLASGQNLIKFPVLEELRPHEFR